MEPETQSGLYVKLRTTEPPWASSALPQPKPMKQLSIGLSRFEAWFNSRFGWFFTNGMKSKAHG